MLLAKAFHGEQRMLQLVFGWLLFHMQKYDEAAPYIERWIKIAPDQIGSIVPMLHLLLRTGRSAEASIRALEHVRGRSKREFQIIRGFYEGIGGLSFDPVAMESVMV